MKITIEVVADDREDAVRLVDDAHRSLRLGKDVCHEVNSCIGDYRITVVDDPETVTPYVNGDRVRCVDLESIFVGIEGTVMHSGPRSTGVQWDGDPFVDIWPNADLERVS